MEKKRSGIQVIAGLIGMVRPLILYMILAVIMGCIGNLCAIFLTVLGGYGILERIGLMKGNFSVIVIVLLIIAVLRGILRYSEQACNHFIAFKLLARIRHKVFEKLRQLAPAKLEEKDKGNLISILTSDIELLEVFYAHTISPVCIAVFTSAVMIIFIGTKHILFGVTAFFSYLIVGVVIPLVNGHFGRERGSLYRKEFGELNTVVLDNLRGMSEILQYGQKKQRLKQMEEKTAQLEQTQEKLKQLENRQKIITDGVILFADAITVVTAFLLKQQTEITFADAILGIIAIMSSFGPVAALASLSNNLNQTLASGNRVLNLLEEQPKVKEITEGNSFLSGDIICDNISFTYKKELPNQSKKYQENQINSKFILENFSAVFKQRQITGILGQSGCGKSTLLKLMMRFFVPNQGSIAYHGISVEELNTSSMRNHIAYVTQDTFLFHDTIANNLRIANENATEEEIKRAAERASINTFIEQLEHGYDTMISELGDSLSGGEKQRLGIARAFLMGADVILLDEPTSNLDSLNESTVLKTLKENSDEKTIILVSHRKSTMNIAKDIIEMNLSD